MHIPRWLHNLEELSNEMALAGSGDYADRLLRELASVRAQIQKAEGEHGGPVVTAWKPESKASG